MPLRKKCEKESVEDDGEKKGFSWSGDEKEPQWKNIEKHDSEHFDIGDRVLCSHGSRHAVACQ